MPISNVSRLKNHSSSHQLQLMHYNEGMQVIDIDAGGELDVSAQEITIPTCTSQDEYDSNQYLTFRFSDQSIWSAAWLRVFLIGEVFHFTTQENPNYANRQPLPNFGPGSSFHLNYQFVSTVQGSDQAIWVIGDIDLIPNDPD